MTLDEFRASYPEVGIAVSAYRPGGDVTVEIILPDGSTAQFSGETEELAWQSLLGLAVSEQPEEPENETSVFD